MTGLPNFRLRLPSRNWLIFLSITGTWTAAVVYDRREKKRIQHKWTKMVEHIAKEPMEDRQMPRKLTVFLGAPPADNIVSAREHFNEYVKPILVAAALDWDAVEGRMQGDVRAGLAARIRKLRIKRGEAVTEVPEPDDKDIVEESRLRNGIHEYNGPAGDIVIGRHTWKEYVRGLHEGWLGPIDPPSWKIVEEPVAPVEATPAPVPTPEASAPASTDDASPAAGDETPKPEEAEKPKEEEKPKKKPQTPAFISTADYSQAQLPPSCPQALGPATAIPLPHLLGFFNFPIRMYRFLNRRQVAEEVGRDTVAAVLGAYRPYHSPSELASTSGDDAEGSWEQELPLKHEEPDWHKSVRKVEEDDVREKVWLNDMVVDPRIGARMRKFELSAEVEESAKHLKVNSEGSSWFSGLWPKKEKKPWEGLGDELD